MKVNKLKRLKWGGALFLLLFIVASCNNSKQAQKGEDNQFAMNGATNAMPPGPPPNGQKPNGAPPGPPPNGGKPDEMPPGGGKPNGMPPGGGMGQQFDTSLIKAALYVTDGEETKKGETIEASGENQSAVATFNKSVVKLSGNKIVTSGNSTSNDQSSFQGLNAAVLGRDDSKIEMDHNSITTTGEGANAIFAYGKSVIYTDSDIIDCTAGGAHGIMASGGGTIVAKNVNMITRGRNSGAVATDRGSGTITVEGGTIKATGADSPGIYSTGEITVSNANVTATGAEVAVIEGSNSIILNNSDLGCSFQDKWGVMIYQSFSGDAEGVDSHFEVNGGSLKCEDKTGPLFFVTNSNANIFLNNTELQTASGILLNAAATNRWGQEGSNGGKANVTATNQTLKGELKADKYSRIQLVLKEKSKLEGNINTSKEAKYVSIEIDNSSILSLTQDSYVNNIIAVIAGDKVQNIIGNGHNLYYSKSECPALNGKKYQLGNGGQLQAY